MEAKALFAKPVLWPLATMLIAALLLVAVAGSASAGTGNKGANSPGKRKCKKGPKAGAKASAAGHKGKHKRKCHKRKPAPSAPAPSAPPATPPAAPVTPPAPPVTPPAPPVSPPVTPPAVAALAITPPSFDFGHVQHGGVKPCKAEGDPSCETFTVTNTGTATSGVLAASILEIRTPEIGEHPAAFLIMANTCTTALLPGASCALTVKFAPNSNAGDQTFESRLDVTASPGNTVSAALNGMAD